MKLDPIRDRFCPCYWNPEATHCPRHRGRMDLKEVLALCGVALLGLAVLVVWAIWIANAVPH